MAEQTENQRKVRDLLSMMVDNGMQTMAVELLGLVREAWEEGRIEGTNQEHTGNGGEPNPYAELFA